MIKNNKAQIGGFLPYLLFGIILVIVFAVVAIPMAYVSDEIYDELKQEKHFGESNRTVAKINQVQALTTPAFDQLVFIILFSIMLGSLFIAMFTDYHPAVLAIFIIATVLLVIVAGLFANVYGEVSDVKLLESKADEFTFTNLVLGPQLPIIILILGSISIIIMLSKRGRTSSPV